MISTAGMKKVTYKDENDLDAGVVVHYKNHLYMTGNRYQEFVELYQTNKFKRVVPIKSVYSLIPC